MNEPRGRLLLDADQATDLYAILKAEHHRRYEMYQGAMRLDEQDPDPVTKEAVDRYRRATRRVERIRKHVLSLIREKGWPEP